MSEEVSSLLRTNPSFSIGPISALVFGVFSFLSCAKGSQRSLCSHLGATGGLALERCLAWAKMKRKTALSTHKRFKNNIKCDDRIACGRGMAEDMNVGSF